MSALDILCTFYSMLSTILNISVLHANVKDSFMDVFKVGNFKVFKVLRLDNEHSCTVKKWPATKQCGSQKVPTRALHGPAKTLYLSKLDGF